MAAVTWRAMNLTGRGEPQLIQVRTVTANFLETLGVRMAQGRDFTADEDRPNGPKVAVLSDGFWRRHFGGRPDVVGQTLRLDGDAYLVVGVTAVGLPLPGDIEIAVPMQADVAKERPPEPRARRLRAARARRVDRGGRSRAAGDRRADRAVDAGRRARLADPPRAARRGHRRRLAAPHPGGAARRGRRCCCSSPAPISRTCCWSAPRRAPSSWRCGRRSANRAARAIAQLLVESLVVTAAGGALGIVIASWSVDALRTLPIARVAEIAVDWRVLAVAVLATLVVRRPGRRRPGDPRDAGGAAGRAAGARRPPGAALAAARRA